MLPAGNRLRAVDVESYWWVRAGGAGVVCRVRACGRVLAVVLGMSAARAADADLVTPQFTSPTLASDSARHWEARFGVFAHGLGGREKGTVDLDGEVASPRLFGGHTGFWSWFIPRLHLGGLVNLSERTSFAYTGLLWTADFTERTFFEIFVGPSVHNGFKDFQPPNMQALGCYVLVHSGVSLGYRLSERWSVLATYQHLSNASSLSHCHRNEGLDNLGIRLSYLF
jgi:lipid A 3-O-deacylase